MSTPSRLHITLIGFMGVTGLGFAVVLPLLIGAIVDQLQLDRSMVGWISSANILGLSLGALASTVLIGKRSLTTIIRSGCLILLLFDALSCWSQEAYFIMALRFFSGIGGGMVYAASLAAFSGLRDSIRAFSLYIICYAVVSGISLFTLPYLIEIAGFQAGFYMLITFSLVSLMSTHIIRRFEALVPSKPMDSLRSLLRRKEVLLISLSYFMLQLAGGVTYTYSERIGRDAGLSMEYIALVLSVGAIMAFFGAYLVIIIGNRFGTRLPVVVGIIFMALFTASLFRSDISWVYFIGMLFTGAWWSFLLPFYQQLQAGYDLMGRVVSIGTLVNMGGRAAGPAMAAASLGTMPFSYVLFISLLSLALALAFIWPLLQNTR